MGESKWRREHGEGPRQQQTQEEFTSYRDRLHRVAKNLCERRVGEAYMRGEAAKAAGVAFMCIHPIDAAPPPLADDDIWLSMRYANLMFRARCAHGCWPRLPDIWPKFYAAIRREFRSFKFKDSRHDARQFVFEMLIENWCWSRGDLGALSASAIAWLATSSGIGDTTRLGIEKRTHRGIHYEIAENPAASANPEMMRTEPPGSHMRNFRLMLMRGTDAEMEQQRNVGVALPLPTRY